MNVEQTVIELLTKLSSLETKVELLWKINIGVIFALVVNLFTNLFNMIKNHNGRKK